MILWWTMERWGQHHSVPKSHIQISLGCTPPMISRYQAAYTGAQKCKVSPKPPCFLSLPSLPQIFCAAARHIWASIVNVSCMPPVACYPLHCAAGQARMGAHMIACSSFQRAAGQAGMRAFMVIYDYFCRPLRTAVCCKLIWLLAVPSSAWRWAGQLSVSGLGGDSQNIQSGLAITNLFNKVPVITRRSKFKFACYSKVRLAGERVRV